MVISMLKIRRPLGRLIFNMGIAIPGKTVFLIETAPCQCTVPQDQYVIPHCQRIALVLEINRFAYFKNGCLFSDFDMMWWNLSDVPDNILPTEHIFPDKFTIIIILETRRFLKMCRHYADY